MRTLAVAVVVISFLWVIGLIAAPVACESTSRSIAAAAAVVYAVGSVVCHQRPERSFFESGHQLPVCARCTGLYVSALVGGVMALMVAASPVPSSRARWILAVAAIPTAVTWSAEFAGFIHPSNSTRAIAALPLGAAAAWLVVSLLGAARRPHHL
jgi:uncharacterized membrane protein